MVQSGHFRCKSIDLCGCRLIKVAYIEQIIGSLAFGESFGGVASGEEHPWISTVIKSLRKGAVGDCMKRFPAVAKLVMTLLSKQIDQMLIETRNHEINSRQLVEK